MNSMPFTALNLILYVMLLIVQYVFVLTYELILLWHCIRLWQCFVLPRSREQQETLWGVQNVCSYTAVGETENNATFTSSAITIESMQLFTSPWHHCGDGGHLEMQKYACMLIDIFLSRWHQVLLIMCGPKYHKLLTRQTQRISYHIVLIFFVAGIHGKQPCVLYLES